MEGLQLLHQSRGSSTLTEQGPIHVWQFHAHPYVNEFLKKPPEVLAHFQHILQRLPTGSLHGANHSWIATFLLPIHNNQGSFVSAPDQCEATDQH